MSDAGRVSTWREGSAAARRDAGLHFWSEAVLIAGVYGAYSIVRNTFGSAAVSPQVAARNADAIIGMERAVGLYVEAGIQDLFIDATAFIQFWNLFYGLFHFLITFVVLIWLYFADPLHYRFWRRAGLITTASALVGFAAFPLMPPRLLGNCGPYGACRSGSPFVDTVVDVGGIWSFESGGFEAISNQYAAMPSLHVAWALWCTLVIVPRVRSRSLKLLAAAYPAMTMFAIVVTANHYWFDGLGAIAAVGAGFWFSRAWDLFALRAGFAKIRVPIRSGTDDLATTVDRGDSSFGDTPV